MGMLLLLLLLSRLSRVRRQPTRLPRPWDSPGKSGTHWSGLPFPSPVHESER